MSTRQTSLKDLLGLTVLLHEQAKKVDMKMENNDAGKVEALQQLFDRRQEAIEELAAIMNQPDFHWTEGERQQIAELREREVALQPLIQGLHQAFLTQMNRISQTKQASKKYIGAYQATATEGSFIDKRK
jgi:flagellar protein FliT